MLLSVGLYPVYGASQALQTSTCTKWFEPRTYQDAIVATHDPANDRPAVIWGKSQTIPVMRIRILDGSSENAFQPKAVTVIYGWRWLEYPYPEHGWGAWNDTGDRLSCVLNHDGWFETPTHEVQPRGWYDGKYTRWPWPHKPGFTGVGLVILDSGGYSARVGLGAKEIQRFSDSVLVIRIFDGWRAETTWVPKS